MGTAARIIEPKQELQTVAVHTTTPGDLLRMAVEQNADLDKLQKLMDLQDRWEANEARKAFTVAMTGFKAEPVEILKRKNVRIETRGGDIMSYNHAELSDVTEAVGPALAKHQLAYDWDINQAGTAITVSCTLTHIRGHAKTVTMTAAPDNSGMKNAIQQVASTTTYLQRYTLLAITGMSTKGMDTDGRPAELTEDEKRASDWLAAADAIATPDEYATRKAELIAAYGEQRLIPKAVMSAFAAKNAALKGAK